MAQQEEEGDGQQRPSISPTDHPTHVTQYALTDSAGRAGLYTGPVRARENDGNTLVPHTTHTSDTGTLVYQGHPTLIKYVGGWYEGAWQGPRGRLHTVKGDTYEGPFESNQMGPGFGRYEWADGRVYTGQFAAGGVKDGQGQYEWPSTGAVYKGSFINNQRSGYGQYTDPATKITYTGEWQNGLYQGYGQYQYEVKGQQITYRGNFEQGQPHGRGTEIGPDGTVRFEGEWVKGKPVKTGTPAGAATQSSPAVVERVVQVVQDQNWIDAYHDNAVATYRGLWNTQLLCPCKNGTAEYEDSEMLRYEGCFNEAGQFHGKGRLVWQNGDVYEGEFELGNRHGSGSYRWSDGRQYTGDFVQNVREGQGRLLYKNSDFYEGGFYQGQRHGNGRFMFANGSMYEGNWAAGKYEGRGTLVQADGRTYVGEFSDGKFHGQGQEMDPTGNMVYDGEFVKGHRAGEFVVDDDDEEEDFPLSPSSVEGAPPAPGVKKRDEPECEAVVDEEITDCQGNLGRYTGIVLKKNRRPQGVGRLVYADGRRIHEGFWHDGSKEGHGRCLFFPQGDFHEGEYQNNLRNGPGRYKWKDGRSFVGCYKDDLRHGKGVFKYPSGDCYDGMFFKGQRSGFGRFDFDGGYYEGEWLAGKYNGKGILSWGKGTQSYEGEFMEGTFHGKGAKKDAAGNIVQEGFWKEGHFQGPDEKKEEDSPRASQPAPAQPPEAHEDKAYETNYVENPDESVWTTEETTTVTPVPVPTEAEHVESVTLD